jgi:hypothetical protein
MLQYLESLIYFKLLDSVLFSKPFPYVGPYTFIKIFLSHIIKALSVAFVRVNDLGP